MLFIVRAWANSDVRGHDIAATVVEFTDTNAFWIMTSAVLLVAAMVGVLRPTWFRSEMETEHPVLWRCFAIGVSITLALLLFAVLFEGTSWILHRMS